MRGGEKRRFRWTTVVMNEDVVNHAESARDVSQVAE